MRGTLIILTAQKLFDLPFLTEVLHETVAQRHLTQPLRQLGLLDPSHCGAVRIWCSLAQPSWNLGPVRPLSLRGANFEIVRANLSALATCAKPRGAHLHVQGDLVQRS